jgi:hypothetical protein
MSAVTTFSVFHRNSFGWGLSNIGPSWFSTLDSAINFATKWERGRFQIRAIDEQGKHTIVHEHS